MAMIECNIQNVLYKLYYYYIDSSLLRIQNVI